MFQCETSNLRYFNLGELIWLDKNLPFFYTGTSQLLEGADPYGD